MKRNVCQSKYDPLVNEVYLIRANPQYAHIRLPDGWETTISTRQFAPPGDILLPEDPLIEQPYVAIEESHLSESIQAHRVTPGIYESANETMAELKTACNNYNPLRISELIRKVPDRLRL